VTQPDWYDELLFFLSVYLGKNSCENSFFVTADLKVYKKSIFSVQMYGFDVSNFSLHSKLAKKSFLADISREHPNDFSHVP